MALAGQASAQIPQAVQIDLLRSMRWASLQGMFRAGLHATIAANARFLCHCTSWRVEMLSGLWHHWQCSGQPLRNTVVRRRAHLSGEALQVQDQTGLSGSFDHFGFS
jgi:hypothetical protein